MMPVLAPIIAQACRNPSQEATVVQSAQPAYPDNVRALGLGISTATVIVTLSPVGAIVALRIEKSAGNMQLDQAALMAARESTYSPKVVNCEPVAGQYLFAVRFDPSRVSPPASPPGAAPPLPAPTSTFPTCEMAAMTEGQRFEVLQERRDYDRAFQAANDAARMQMACAQQVKTPERFSLEMMAGATLSHAADVAYYVGGYQQARDFATRANAIYAELTAPSIDQNYGRFLTPNAKANIQANDDLMKRIGKQQKCVGEVSAPIISLVLGQMPDGSTIRAIGVTGKYAVAIAIGPGGYAIRSFLLVSQNGWKIRTSEGGAFDLAAYRRNGVPPSIAAKLASSVACGGSG